MPDLSADTRVLFSLPADSDTVIVAFGGANTPRDRTPYQRLMGQVHGCSKISVRDPANAWYQAGLPGMGDTLERLTERLRLEISALGATRVFTFGISMGGYGAILFGCMLGATRAVAFAPQTFLDPPLGYAPPAGVRLQAPDLEPIARDSRGVEIDLFVPVNDLIDVVHARNLARIPSVRVLAVDSATHGFVAGLHRAGKLAPFLSQLERREVPDFAQPCPPLSADDDRRIRDAAFAKEREDWRMVRERIEPVAARHPRWAAPSFHLGEALLNLGEPTRAEDLLRRVERESSSQNTARLQLCQALRSQGKVEEAEQTIRDGIAADPGWIPGWLGLAQLLSELGRGQEARTAAREAERMLRPLILKHPRTPAGHRGPSRALCLQGRFGEAQGAMLLADRCAL